jgi:hypothetical protein
LWLLRLRSFLAGAFGDIQIIAMGTMEFMIGPEGSVMMESMNEAEVTTGVTGMIEMEDIMEVNATTTTGMEVVVTVTGMIITEAEKKTKVGVEIMTGMVETRKEGKRFYLVSA